MRNTIPTAVIASAIAALVACEMPEEQEVAPPTLSDVSTERSTVDLVDRSAALDGALDYDLAPIGAAADLTGPGALMDFSGEGMVDTEGVPTERNAAYEYSNVFAGYQALVFAETVRHAVVVPPAIAMAFAANGQITQQQPNVWVAENTIDLPEQGRVTAHFTVAYVGVGWLGEMRVSDDTRSQALWFNGFIGAEGGIGWWDLYGLGGAREASVEWIADGQGNGHFGIAATAGDHAGSTLVYNLTPALDRIDAYDGATGNHGFVQAWADESGAVSLPELEGGLPQCWDADFKNTPCPAAE